VSPVTERPPIPCQPSPCGANAVCQLMNGHEACSCYPGYIGPPPNCRPECVINSECPTNKACIQRECGDPCIGSCGINAKCDVVNHNAICSCPQGYIGDPFSQCSLRPPTPQPQENEDPCRPDPCGSNTDCERRNEIAACKCKPNYFGNPYIGCKPECLANTDCAQTQACMSQKCRDPCPGSCGDKADCRVVGHNPICSCPAGYTGDPLESCRYVPPVGKFLKMALNLKPNKQNNVFYFTFSEPSEVEVDPCGGHPCGPYSQEREQDGHCVCSCLPNYLGVAPNCRPECIVSSDCSQLLACVNQKCVDPCAADICGTNARCQVVNHNAICQCPNGYIGDPFSRCTTSKLLKILKKMLLLNLCLPEPPVEPVIEEPRHPCYPSPCGPNSECREEFNVAGCLCKPGYVGVPPNCRPECVLNADCPSNMACVQQKCRDPCPGTCGRNANCQVITHRPTCTCPAGYTGDPYSASCSPQQISKDHNCHGYSVLETMLAITHFISAPAPVIDPCNPTPCGANAQCTQRNKGTFTAVTCSCIPGYFGDPFLSCRPECIQNQDCPSNKVCTNQKCVDPCPGLCGINAICNVHNHFPRCDCLQGYEGNPSVECKRIPPKPGMPI
jgi:hypothetical protein